MKLITELKAQAYEVIERIAYHQREISKLTSELSELEKTIASENRKNQEQARQEKKE